jgi:hypothetical protein
MTVSAMTVGNDLEETLTDLSSMKRARSPMLVMGINLPNIRSASLYTKM